MTFLHPWAIWLGVAAAAAPVVVHLLTRPRPVRMPLSTLRFVREAIRQRRTRHRLRDLLVLALRTAAVLLLAAALARPQWGRQATVSDEEAGDAVRVVVLDLSQSMAATTGSVQAIERARPIAADYLQYRPGLRANLILAAASSRAVFDGPSSNFDALRDELARCKVLPQRVDVPRALALAARMLAPANQQDQRRRELVVVSDFQRANWARADFAQLPAGTKIQLELVAPEKPPPNVAILRAEGHARSSRGRSVQLEIEVGNFTPTARKVTVEVNLGESAWRLEGNCPAGGRTTLAEEIPLRSLGWQSGEARLAGVDDALSADDTRPLVARIRSRPTYALLTRQPSTQRPSSSHFLECALVPDRDLSEEPSAKLVRVDPAGPDRQVLGAADLIVLDHPGKLEADTVALLAGLLRRGRPILYVAGELIDATNLKLLVEAAGGGLRMPVEFTPPPAGQVRRGLLWASVRGDEPPFRVFGDRLAAVTGRLRFAGGLSSRRLERGLQQDVLATYSDGSAGLVLTSSDAGALAVINADLAASSLPRTGAFVPLLDELVDRMLQRNRRRDEAVCGEQLVVNLPAESGAASTLRIVGPERSAPEGPDGRFGELTDEGLGTAWHWPAPGEPGVYCVQRDGATVFCLAVSVPAEESQLDSLPAEVLTERLAGGRDVGYRSAGGEGDRRDDLWKWLAAACVVCLLSEVGLLLAFRT